MFGLFNDSKQKRPEIHAEKEVEIKVVERTKDFVLVQCAGWHSATAAEAMRLLQQLQDAGYHVLSAGYGGAICRPPSADESVSPPTP